MLPRQNKTEKTYHLEYSKDTLSRLPGFDTRILDLRLLWVFFGASSNDVALVWIMRLRSELRVYKPLSLRAETMYKLAMCYNSLLCGPLQILIS